MGQNDDNAIYVDFLHQANVLLNVLKYSNKHLSSPSTPKSVQQAFNRILWVDVSFAMMWLHTSLSSTNTFYFHLRAAYPFLPPPPLHPPACTQFSLLFLPQNSVKLIWRAPPWPPRDTKESPKERVFFPWTSFLSNCIACVIKVMSRSVFQTTKVAGHSWKVGQTSEGLWALVTFRHPKLIKMAK